jgi:hypothetical protein
LQIYIPFISEIYKSRLKALKPGEKPNFVLMITERLQLLPALPPAAALVALVGRDLMVLVLGPAYRQIREALARRRRRSASGC